MFLPRVEQNRRLEQGKVEQNRIDWSTVDERGEEEKKKCVLRGDSDCVLQVIVVVGRSYWNCHIKDAILKLGFARNMPVFRVQRRFLCGEKLVCWRDRFGRCRFSAESASNWARSVTEVSK